MRVLRYSVSMDGYCYGWYPVEFIHPIDALLYGAKRVVLLNSPLAFANYLAWCEEIDTSTAKEVVFTARMSGKMIESYIGHEATARVISDLLGTTVPVNRDMFTPTADKEVALVFRLKKRLEKPSDVENVTPSDIQVLVVQYVRPEAEIC